jgi:hypothetical protein
MDTSWIHQLLQMFAQFVNIPVNFAQQIQQLHATNVSLVNSELMNPLQHLVPAMMVTLILENCYVRFASIDA